MTFLERFRVKRKHLLSLTYFLIEFRHFCCLRDSLQAFLKTTVYIHSTVCPREVIGGFTDGENLRFDYLDEIDTKDVYNVYDNPYEF